MISDHLLTYLYKPEHVPHKDYAFSVNILETQDIAQLKGFRFQSNARDQGTLQNKISDTERSYFQRKMVVAKAAQLGEPIMGVAY